MKKLFPILVVFIILLMSCGSATVPTPEQLTTIGISPIDTDLELPDIGFTDSEGKARLLSEFEGSVVLLNFWATWCPPCLAEMPSMGILAESLEKTDFEMIALNVGEKEALVESFVQEFNIDIPIYYDTTTAAASEMGISSLPTTMLLDRKGKVLGVAVGAVEWDDPEIIRVLREWAR